MDSKIIERDNYNICTYNTDKFKSIEMHVVYRYERKIDDYLTSALIELLFITSKYYKNRRERFIKQEELYNIDFDMRNYTNGKHFTFDLSVSLIDPVLVNDDYLNEAIKYPFDIFNNPSFDESVLDEVKNKLINRYKKHNEEPAYVAHKNALNIFYEDDLYKADLIANEELINAITIDDIKNKYNQLIKEANVKVYVLGNINKVEDEIINIIDNNIKANKNELSDSIIKTNTVDKVKEETIIKEGVNQAQIIYMYNTPTVEVDDRKKILLFNFIFGSLGLNSRLFNNVREKHQICYSINSSYNYYSSYLSVSTGVDLNKIDLAKEEINNTFASMKEITDEELEAAKNKNISSLTDTYSYLYSTYRILDNINTYGFKSVEEEIEIVKSITKEDIEELVNEIKLNSICILKGDK